MRRPESVQAAVAAVVEHFGRLDILVNNAGVPAGMQVAPFRTLLASGAPNGRFRADAWAVRP